ncbi:hypothetical protein WJX74_011050 [Apatococcus lobatus]|uniref:FAS1 domain-containing protein n=1 Tax=Apatococcus lobatus TaxID=904363 RepID=A0AAW1QCR4_9CHLO
MQQAFASAGGGFASAGGPFDVSSLLNNPFQAPSSSPSLGSAETILGAMQAQPSLKSLNALLQATGLSSQLNNSATSATVFAPTDQAFLNLAKTVGEGALGTLGRSKSLVTQMLNNHIVEDQALQPNAFKNGQSLQTQASGESLKVASTAGQVLVTPSAASTGILLPPSPINVHSGTAFVYVIDSVLLSNAVKSALQAAPPTAAPSG